MFRYALALLIAFLATPALALPAPMSERELMDKSDIVAVIRVLSVSCIAVTKDEKSGEELPAYLAKARLIDVKKGDAKKGDEILVTFRATPKNVLGPWTVYYYPGEVVLTPFMGVGSEVAGALMNGRKAVGIELKPSYYRQAVKNVSAALEQQSRLPEQSDLFFGAELPVED